MAFMKMSLGYVIFMALHVISYVTGIAQTWSVVSHGELATHHLADVTYMHRMGLEFRLYNSKWYSKGMQIFAYRHKKTYFFTKRNLTWGIMESPKVLDVGYVISALQSAMAKWAKVSPFTFRQVTPRVTGPNPVIPEIRIDFDRNLEYVARTINSGRYEDNNQDLNGATIRFLDSDCLYNRSDKSWCNIRFLALYEMGRALGLSYSDDPNSIMYEGDLGHRGCHPGLYSPHDTDLGEDDIKGIQARYGPPSGSGMTPRTYSGREPPVSNSSNTPSFTHPRYPGPGSFYGRGSTRNKIGGIQAGYGPPSASGMATRTYSDQKAPASSSSDSPSSSDSSSPSDSSSSSSS